MLFPWLGSRRPLKIAPAERSLWSPVLASLRTFLIKEEKAEELIVQVAVVTSTWAAAPTSRFPFLGLSFIWAWVSLLGKPSYWGSVARGFKSHVSIKNCGKLC